MFKDSKLEFHTLVGRLVIHRTWELFYPCYSPLKLPQSQPALQLPPHQKQLLAVLHEITTIYLTQSGWLCKDFPSSVLKL